MDRTRLSILIIDDHLPSALSLAHFCQAIAERIDVAYSASEAMELLRVISYDCIVVDCRLPDIDGLDLARWIRGTPGQPNRQSPIVGVSADIRYTDERCVAAGMSAFVSKPYTPCALIDLIGSLV